MRKRKNFFDSGQSKSKRQKHSLAQFEEIWKQASENERKFQEKLWEKACEAERNFQKAVDMADGFPPPKSEEYFKFLEKWLFFYFFSSQEK